MLILLFATLARAEDPPPEPPLDAPRGEQLVIIEGDRVARARAELVVALKREGYTRSEVRGEYTVFKNKIPYKPQVWVHADGWVSLRRQPPRVHSPFHTFSDQGSPAEYLLCIIMPTACVSVGGWAIGPRKLARQEQEVYDSTRAQVKALNDAVARNHLETRLNNDIPTDLAKIWDDTSLPVADRHLLLFTYWDTRTETAEGKQARQAIRAYLIGVVQASANPFTQDELAALNASRQSVDALSLEARSIEP